MYAVSKLCRLEYKSWSKGIVHNGIRIVVRSLDLVQRQFSDDVVKGLFPAPAIGRLGQCVVDRLFVPHDSRLGVLVFVGGTERMADLVYWGIDLVGDVPPQIHGPFIGGSGDIDHIPAHIRPGPVARHKTDAYLSLVLGVHFLEFEAYVLTFPSCKSLFDRVFLCRSPFPRSGRTIAAAV